MPQSEPLISYAQNGEDIVLARGLRSDTGFYVDIGAYDPHEDSVTKLFYDRGWSGINVDPIPEVIAAFERDRPRDINVQVAISKEAGTADLWTGPSDLIGHSTMDAAIAEAHSADGLQFTRSSVRTMRLDDLLEKSIPSGTVIDFLKVDVEGFEQQVLESCDWSQWHPRVIVVECIVPYSKASSHHDWEHILVGNGYTMTMFDGLNRFYVDSAEPDLIEALSAPASVVDLFEKSAVHQLSIRFAELTEAKEEAAAARAAHEQMVGQATVERIGREQAELEIDALRAGLAELSILLAENIERQRALSVEIDRRDVLLDDVASRTEILELELEEARCEEARLRAEVLALNNTKVFRYSRVPRRIYGRLLRH